MIHLGITASPSLDKPKNFTHTSDKTLEWKNLPDRFARAKGWAEIQMQGIHPALRSIDYLHCL